MRFPRNLMEWRGIFKDDLGFEPHASGLPTSAAPGSPEKIAILRERVDRGQRLFLPTDGKIEGPRDELYEDPGLTFKFCGTDSKGAVVGNDYAGDKHRYAIWTDCKPDKQPSRNAKPVRLLYVQAVASYVDSFERDAELAAILAHAKKLNAEFVGVVPLFSARVKTERELADRAYPVTEFGLQWIRWLATQMTRVVVCWGEMPMLERHVDVLWLLNRTCSCQIYSLSEEGKWPPPVNRVSEPKIYRFDVKAVIAEREEESEEDGDDGDD